MNIKEKFQNYYNDKQPIEALVVKMMLLGSCIGGIFCVIAAIIVNAPIQPTIICLCLMAYTLLCYSIAKKTNKYIKWARISILGDNWILFPAIFFTSGGMNGGCMPYFILGVIFCFIVFDGPLCWTICIFQLVLDAFLIYASYRWPILVSSVNSPEYTSSMLCFNLIIASLVSGIIIKVILNHNENEKKKIDDTLSELEDLSIRDSLTKVYNRRYLMDFIQTNIDRAYNYGATLSIAMFDIDHFKNLNDTYGHLVGDEVLKNLCAVIGRKTRSTDILSRYGGEEFIVVFPNATKETAYKRAEEIRVLVEDSILTKETTETITVSGGISEYIKGMTVEELIDVADKNLYVAKDSGRNQICASQDDEIATLIKQEIGTVN